MAPSLFQVYNEALDKGVNGAMQNTLLASIVLVVSMLYSTQLRPPMPAKFEYVFTTWPVRLILLTLAMVVINRNPAMSFLLVSSVIVGSHYASAVDSFELLNTEVLAIDSNCEDITYDDLLKVYDGDGEALERFARSAGLPLNRAVKDHAPLVATLMLQHEIPVTPKCASVYNQTMTIN